MVFVLWCAFAGFRTFNSTDAPPDAARWKSCSIIIVLLPLLTLDCGCLLLSIEFSFFLSISWGQAKSVSTNSCVSRNLIHDKDLIWCAYKRNFKPGTTARSRKCNFLQVHRKDSSDLARKNPVIWSNNISSPLVCSFSRLYLTVAVFHYGTIWWIQSQKAHVGFYNSFVISSAGMIISWDSTLPCLVPLIGIALGIWKSLFANRSSPTNG